MYEKTTIIKKQLTGEQPRRKLKKINELTHISTKNITELNELIHVGVKLVCEKSELP